MIKTVQHSIITTLLLLLTNSIYAQFDVVYGSILHTNDSTPLEGVHIVNKKNHLGVISKENGYFSISASKGDTLIISSIGFTTKTFVVEKSRFSIYLYPAVYNLEDFTVLPYKDYEEFKEAFTQLRIIEKDPINQSIYVPKEELLAAYQEANGGIILSGGISAILGAFNKYVQDKKNYERLLAKDQQEAAIKKRFNPEKLMQITAINNLQTAENFLEYCNFSEDFILFASEYELHKQIHICFDEYKSYVLNH